MYVHMCVHMCVCVCVGVCVRAECGDSGCVVCQAQRTVAASVRVDLFVYSEQMSRGVIDSGHCLCRFPSELAPLSLPFHL